MFRQNVNNPAVVEQHKLVEARKRIETVSCRGHLFVPLGAQVTDNWIGWEAVPVKYLND